MTELEAVNEAVDDARWAEKHFPHPDAWVGYMAVLAYRLDINLGLKKEYTGPAKRLVEVSGDF